MFTDMLAQGARAMGVSLSNTQLEQIRIYHEMLSEAGRRTNLTRVSDDFRESIDRNYLDSLAPLSIPGLLTNPETLADAGTGAGLPGVILSIALPGTRVTLIDALGKRIAFLNEVIKALNLNACAIHARCEDAGRHPDLRDRFDVVTSRALADTSLLAEYALPLVKPGGHMIAYKGPAVDEEVERARHAFSELCARPEAVYPAPIPGRDWEHKLLIVKKESPTPAKYPRKAGVPERKPL